MQIAGHENRSAAARFDTPAAKVALYPSIVYRLNCEKDVGHVSVMHTMVGRCKIIFTAISSNLL